MYKGVYEEVFKVCSNKQKNWTKKDRESLTKKLNKRTNSNKKTTVYELRETKDFYNVGCSLRKCKAALKFEKRDDRIVYKETVCRQE